MRITVIGLGGIGTALVYPLARYLTHAEGDHELLLVDGDEYEPRNLVRQDVQDEAVGTNKAAASADRLRIAFPTVPVEAMQEYVTRRNVGASLAGTDVVLLCVDNHKARKVLQDGCRNMRDIILISGGNELLDGNVLIFAKKNGRMQAPPIDKYHDEIASPVDTDDPSCEEMVAAGGGQIIFTNMTAACLMLNAFYTATTSKLMYSEVYFDISKNMVRAIERK